MKQTKESKKSTIYAIKMIQIMVSLDFVSVSSWKYLTSFVWDPITTRTMTSYLVLEDRFQDCETTIVFIYTQTLYFLFMNVTIDGHALAKGGCYGRPLLQAWLLSD